MRTQTPPYWQTSRQPDRQMPTFNNNINIGITMTAAALTYMLVKSGKVRGSYLPLQFLRCTFRPRRERERDREREKERERVQWSSAAPSPGTPILRSEDEKRSLHYQLETTPPPLPSSLPAASLSLPASSRTQSLSQPREGRWSAKANLQPQPTASTVRENAMTDLVEGSTIKGLDTLFDQCCWTHFN